MAKFYDGAESKEFERKLKVLFRSVHREKPESSRSVSIDIRKEYLRADCYPI